MAEAATARQTDPARGIGPRFRISGIMLLVLVACVTLARFAEFHAFEIPGRSVYGESPWTHWLDLALTPVEMALLLVLGIQVHGLWKRRKLERGGNWPLCWRCLAIVLLLIFLVESSSVLKLVVLAQGELSGLTGQINWPRLDSRLRLLPSAEGLLMIGLVLGLRSRVPRSGHRRAAVLPAWAAAVLTGLGGALIVATLMLIPYLVLVAVEAVWNAMKHPGEALRGFRTDAAMAPPTVGLAGRIDGATPVIGLAFLIVLLTVGWLGGSLRGVRERGDRGAGRDLALGLILALAVLGATAQLVWRTMPTIQPLFVSGLEQSLDNWSIGLVSLAFGVFAAGLIAHVLSPSDGPPAVDAELSLDPRVGGFTVLMKGVAVALLLTVIVTSLAEIGRRYPSAGWIGLWLSWAGSLDPLNIHGINLWTWLQGSGLGLITGHDASLWFPLLVIPWLGWRALVLLISVPDPRPSCLDRVFNSPASRRRMIGYWCALWAMLLASVPTLGLAGLAILHRFLGP